jgi:hypothetical protein
MCIQPANVWLSNAEQAEYARGERFFFAVGQGRKAIEVI